MNYNSSPAKKDEHRYFVQTRCSSRWLQALKKSPSFFRYLLCFACLCHPNFRYLHPFFSVHDLIPFWMEIFQSTSFSFQPFPPFQTHSYIPLVAGTGIPMYRISPTMRLWQITWSSWLQVLLVAVYVVSWCRNKKHFLWFCCLEIFSVHLPHGKWIRCVCIS